MHQTENLLVTVEKQFPERYREYYGINPNRRAASRRLSPST
jgi:hypothetical protein